MDLDPTLTHCYTNLSFCRQSEYLAGSPNDLPPPPQFQVEELPPPPPPHQLQYGQANPAFQVLPEQANTDLYYQEKSNPATHRRCESLPVNDDHRLAFNQQPRYEHIQDTQRDHLQRRKSSRYEYIPQVQRSASSANQDNVRFQTWKNNNSRYAVVPGDQGYQEEEGHWTAARYAESPSRRQMNTSQGVYSRVPLQDEESVTLPERNLTEPVSPRNNLATQKLHELLTTPRKPRSRSEERTLSPRKYHSPNGTPQRRAVTPGGSPHGVGETLSSKRSTPLGTPQTFPSKGPQTSTPNKEPSARRCLPLSGNSTRSDLCPASNCGRLRYVGTAPVDIRHMNELSPRYGYLDGSNTEAVPMVSGSPRYQVIPSSEQKRNGYQSVESAFIARTAVVTPLSPPNSDANTTLASGIEKNERRNAPLLLILVGVLTCGLALYLSWSQGRRYYLDSAAGCGICCALAGACRSLRRTWTGLGLAGLSAVSCAGLLLLAAKAPRPGTPLHDITAGALCGVSLLGASLALLALLAPKCNCGRHRRVHSWIPRFSP